MKKKLVTAFAIAALSFGACKTHDTRHAEPSGAPADPVAYKMAEEGQTADRAGAPGWTGKVTDNRKIIRTGAMSVVVETYDDARAAIEAMVAAAGGFVDSTRVSHSEGRVSSAQIVVRIPAASFGDLMPKLRALGEVTDESTDSADITAEYVDQSARLESARALEKRLLELAAVRTGTVADVLEVERELARVRAEIEQYEGMIRMWDDQVSLSTLTISLSTKQPEIASPPAPGFRDDASSTFDRSMTALKDAGTALLLALIALLPWMPLIIPAGFLGRRLYRKMSAALPKAVVYHYPPPPPPPPVAPAG